MNIKRSVSLGVLIFIQSIGIYSGGLVEKLTKTTGTNQKIFIGIIEEKGQQLAALQEEHSVLVAEEKAFADQIKVAIQETQTLITAVENELRKTPDDEFLSKKQTILKENYQVLNDTQRVHEDLLSTLENFINALKKYLDDPEFAAFRKEYKLQERLYYSFEDLQKLHERILDQERRINQLGDQEKSLRAERDSIKRSTKAAKEAYEKRQQELRSFVESGVEDLGFGMNIRQEQELLQLEEQIYNRKNNLNELHLREIEYKISYIYHQLFIAKAHLDMFKGHLHVIKPAIRVSEADVALSKEELAKERQKYFSRKEVLRKQRDKIATSQKETERELNQVSKQLNIMLGRDIDEWDKEPKQTADSYLAIAKVGALNDHVRSLATEKDLIDAQIALEDEKFNYQSLRAIAKETYHKISIRRFLTEEDISQERKKYDMQKENANASLQSFKEKITAVANLLNQKKKVVDNIKALRQEAVKKKESVFRNKGKAYSQFLDQLNLAEDYVKKQVDVLGKLTGVYSGITSEINSNIRLVDFMIGELQASTIWYRPAYAITWDGIKNIVPDVTSFLNDIRLYITEFDVAVFIVRIQEAFSDSIATLIFLLKLMAVLIVFLLVKRYQSGISAYLFEKCRTYRGLILIGCFLLSAILSFAKRYYVTLIIWFSLLLICQMVPDPYLFIIYYLLSIPYLLFLSQRFIKLIIHLNTQYEYMLLPADFQRRFEFVISALLYVTISILFFRQAFMLSSYYLRSELSNILLAVNFIFFQISLIFLISKEQILSIIPERTEAWKWIRAQVDKYYYLILLVVMTIIIMSNPYVGFGRLVLYLLFSLLYTALLIKGLLWVHGLFKNAASYVFFSYEETVVRERFPYAKTCFGLLIIASFFIFCFIGFIIGAKIWGWPITFKDVTALLNEPLMLKGTKAPVSTLSLLQIIMFILSGFLVAYALNKFVLAKIFDLLLVESGIQHTVTRIVQYIVIIIAIFIGFQNVGLGSLIGYLFTVLAFSVGWYIKDPISDFFAYFIILVQRPIKIGDYVKIDSETSGVVRKITPRSVVIRRKNSTTLIVPNSYVVSRSIENWNYVRNYVAFNDIILLIPYKANPQEVKAILFSIVEAHQNVLKNPKPIVRLDAFGEYGYTFMLRGFISSAYTLEMWDIASDIRLAIVKALRENGIEIAVPVRRIIDSHYHTLGEHIPDPQSKKLKE